MRATFFETPPMSAFWRVSARHVFRDTSNVRFLARTDPTGCSLGVAVFSPEPTGCGQRFSVGTDRQQSSRVCFIAGLARQ